MEFNFGTIMQHLEFCKRLEIQLDDFVDRKNDAQLLNENLHHI